MRPLLIRRQRPGLGHKRLALTQNNKLPDKLRLLRPLKIREGGIETSVSGEPRRASAGYNKSFRLIC